MFGVHTILQADTDSDAFHFLLALMYDELRDQYKPDMARLQVGLPIWMCSSPAQGTVIPAPFSIAPRYHVVLILFLARFLSPRFAAYM